MLQNHENRSRWDQENGLGIWTRIMDQDNGDDRTGEKWIDLRYILEVVLIGYDNSLDLGQNEEIGVKNNI